MIANIQGLHTGSRKNLTPVEWLQGAWTKPGDGCCIPARAFVLTPMGENTFRFDGPAGTNTTNHIYTGTYTRNGEESSTFKGNSLGKTVKELTVVDENTLNGHFAPEGGMAVTCTITKDAPTNHKAVPANSAPHVQVMKGREVRVAPE